MVCMCERVYVYVCGHINFCDSCRKGDVKMMKKMTTLIKKKVYI